LMRFDLVPLVPASRGIDCDLNSLDFRYARDF
jgi:hypothetical protein